MNDKIEIAKLSMQLTLAILGTNNGETMKITHGALVAGVDKNTPDALVVFDVVFAHLQASLIAQ